MRSIASLSTIQLVLFFAFPSLFFACEASALLEPAVSKELCEDRSKGQLAVINDPDGFANVRTAPNADADIVCRFLEDELFICRPDHSDWWPVSDFFGSKGFMHRSRITCAGDMSDAALDRVIVNPDHAPEDEIVGIHELWSQHGTYLYKHPDGLLAGDLRISGINSLHTNGDRSQFVYMSCYMDGPHHTILFSKDPPDVVLCNLEVHRKEGKETPPGEIPSAGCIADLDEVKSGWSTLAAACLNVSKRHFRTMRGLALGDSVEKVVKTFGDYYHKRNLGDIDIYEWGFAGRYYRVETILQAGVVGDDVREQAFRDAYYKGSRLSLNEDESRRLKSKLNVAGEGFAAEPMMEATKGPRLSKEFGFYATAFFRNGRLIALEYVQGVP